jgi:GTPase involved in cell partitioning and DNA repair
LKNELEKFDPTLMQKDQMVLINKIDIHSPGHRNIESMRSAFEEMGIEAVPISAKTGEGLDEVKQILARKFHDGQERPGKKDFQA